MENYLVHHGILGMKWGVRRFQNKDGSLTAAGRSHYGYGPAEQKKAYKEIREEHKRASSREQLYKNYLSDDTNKQFKAVIEKHVNNVVSDEDKKELSDLMNKMYNSSKNLRGEFEESKYYEQATKEAYNETLKWYKKNNPDFLDEVYKEHGKNVDLTMIHGFRKTYEGYEDEILSKYEEQWRKSPEGKKSIESSKLWNTYYKEYESKCKEITNNILGKYGNDTISKYGDKTYKDIVDHYVSGRYGDYVNSEKRKNFNQNLESMLANQYNSKTFEDKDVAANNLFKKVEGSISVDQWSKLNTARNNYLKTSNEVNNSNDDNYKQAYAKYEAADKQLTDEIKKTVNDLVDKNIGSTRVKDISKEAIDNKTVNEELEYLLGWQYRRDKIPR